MLTFNKLYTAWRQLDAASQHYGVSRSWICLRAMRLHNTQLFSLKEMLLWGFLDPAIADEELDLYVSQEARTRLQLRLNVPDWNIVMDDKALFDDYCQMAGLPTPTTIGVFAPPGNAEADAHRRRWQALLKANGQQDFICKPVNGEGGEGIFAIQSEGANFCVYGLRLTADELYEYLVNYGGAGGLLIQHRLRPHPVLRAASGSEALQTARIVTFLHDDGSCHLMITCVKFAIGGNLTDNFHDGHSGNLVAHVEAETGTVRALVYMVPGAIGMRRTMYHPETGYRLVGMVIPGWSAVCEVARAAAKAFSQLRTVGWDIAVTADGGAILIEGNTEWIGPMGPMRRPIPREEWRALLRAPRPVTMGVRRLRPTPPTP